MARGKQFLKEPVLAGQSGLASVRASSQALVFWLALASSRLLLIASETTRPFRNRARASRRLSNIASGQVMWSQGTNPSAWTYNGLFGSTDFSNVFVPHIGNPLFGNFSQRIGNGLIFGVAAKEAGCQRTYPRPHPRTRVSRRAHVHGQLVHSNSHLAMALQEEAGLPLRRNLLLGLRTLLLRITENKAATRQYRNIFPPRRRNGACVLRTQ